MIARRLRTAGLLVLLMINTLSGAAKVAGFRDRDRGEKALAEGALDRAVASLNASRRWQPGDAPTYVLIGRVIQLAEANGLPLKELEGYTLSQMLGVGARAVSWAIALNPADGWAWFNLADVYRASRSARLRHKALKAAGEAAGAGGSREEAAAPPGSQYPPSLDPEERLMAALALKALELEPAFYFYHDFLASLYRRRGFGAEAAREISESVALMPALQAHALLEDEAVLRDLSEPILEGLQKATTNPFAAPDMVARARAELLERLGRLPEAIEAALEMGRIGGREYGVECDLVVARLYQKQRKYRESIPFLDRVLEADPDGGKGAWALYYRGVAHARLSEHGSAVKDLRGYFARRPGTSGDLLTYGDELASAGEPADAERVYLGVVRSFPAETAALRRLITLMQRQRRWKDALEYAGMLRKLDPEDRTAEVLSRQMALEAAP